MRREIFTSGLWLLAGNILQQVMQLATFILLARFLSPSIFGYVAMASVVIDVAATIGMWGLIQAAQQRRAVLSSRLISHIFALSMLIAAALSLLIVAGVGIYSGMDHFTLTCQLILMLIPILFFQALGIAPEAILYRNMEFKWLAVRNNMAAFLGGSVALILALLGMEVYALVIQKLVALMTLCIVVWIAAGSQIRILNWKNYDRRMFRALLRIGGQIVSVPIAATLSSRTMDAMIGGFLGPAALGSFKIAIRIFELLQQFTSEPLRAVTNSAFPKLFHKPAELESIYKQVVTMSGILVIPAFAGLGFTAPQWVPLVLGPQWLSAIPLFHILSFNAVYIALSGLQISLILAYRKNLFVLLENVASTVAVAILTFIGVQFGLNETVACYVLVCYGVMIYNQFYLSRMTGWHFTASLRVIVPSFLATLVMLAALEGVKTFYMPENKILALAALIATGAVTYGSISLLAFREELLPIIRKILKRDSLSSEITAEQAATESQEHTKPDLQ